MTSNSSCINGTLRHRHDNRIHHRAVASGRSDNILLIVSSGGNRAHRRTSGGSNDTITRPRVAHNIIVKAIKISVQNDHLTLANLHFISHQLQISTELIHREVNLGLAIGDVILNRQRIDTRLVGVLRSIITSSGSTSRNCPRIGVIARTTDHVSRDVVGSCTVANLVVARDANFGRQVHFRRLVRRRCSRGNTLETKRLSREMMHTCIIQVHIHCSQILSGDLNTVQEPFPTTN